MIILLSKIFIYFNYYVFFLLELFIAQKFYLSKRRRKKHFCLRVILSVIGVLLTTWGIMEIINLLDSYTVYFEILNYILVFMLTLIGFKLCYNEKFLSILIGCVAGYATQHIAGKVFLIILFPGGLYSIIASSIWLITVIRVAVMVPMYVLLYFLLVKKIDRNAIMALKNKSIMVLSIATLSITIVLSAIVDNFVTESVPLVVAFSILSIICCLFVLYTQYGMAEKIRLAQEYETAGILWKKEKNQYELFKETIDIINIKCHDLKHQINALRNSGEDISREELMEIEAAVTIYDSSMNTGNEALDTILTEKSLFCEKNMIRLSCMADGAKLSFIALSDLYSLFGNAIDNAIHAVLKIDDPDKRIININIRSEFGVLFIQIQNYYAGNLDFENELPKTTQEDKNYHGFGMKSMKMIIEKYDGLLSAKADDSIFSLNMMMPSADNPAS